MREFGPSPVSLAKDLIALNNAMIEWICASFGIPKELLMEPKDKEHEVVQVYNDPKADTTIWYDENDQQHAEVKDDNNG